MAKEKVNLRERAENLLQNIKMAESLNDFDLMRSNLDMISELLYMNDEDNAKKFRKLKITEYLSPTTVSKLTRTLRGIKSDIDAEQVRRKEIKGYGDSYDVLKNQLEKYDTVQIEFSNRLDRIPDKELFVYDTISSSYKEEDIQNLYDKPEYKNKAIMIDYFNSIADILGIDKSTLVGKTFADIEQMFDDKGKELDELAFKIDRANGIYNLRMVEKDAAAVNKYVLQQELKSKFPDVYKEAYIGDTRTKEQILDDAIAASRPGATQNALKEIKKLGDFDDLLAALPEDIKDNILMDNNKISSSDLTSELMRLSGGTNIARLPSPTREICESLMKIQHYESNKAIIKRNSKNVYAQVFSEPAGPAGKAAIDKKISELKGLPQTKARKAQIEFLQSITDFNLIDRSELDGLYEKYDVDPTKPASDLQKAITDISKLEHEADAIDNSSYGEFSSSNLKTLVNTSHLNQNEPVQRVEGGLFTVTKDSPQNISDYVTQLAQTKGYSPTVGKESFVYARPIYSGRIFKKLDKVEIVEESIASIAANPLKAYQEALKDYNEKLGSLGMTPLKRKEMEEMDEIVAKLIKNSKKNYNDPELSAKYMDEVIKRIISLKSCNTRTDLLRAKDEHLHTYNPTIDPKDEHKDKFNPVRKVKNNNSVTFPGDHDYEAPQVKYVKKNGKIFKSKQIEVDVNTPATSATQEKSAHARNFLGEQRLSNNTTITREQMQQEAQRRARAERDAMRRRATRRDSYDRDDD